MGYRMAGHLLRAGHDVALWSHTGGKAEKLAKEGKGTVCATPRDAAERSDFIFICVGNTGMVREVALGKDGLIQSAKKGTVIADCSSIAPNASIEIGKEFAAKGVDFLDSPVTGSTGGADKATLTFMVGGDKAAYEKAKPYMELMGKLFYYCGPSGQGLKANGARLRVCLGLRLSRLLPLGFPFRTLGCGLRTSPRAVRSTKGNSSCVSSRSNPAAARFSRTR